MPNIRQGSLPKRRIFGNIFGNDKEKFYNMTLLNKSHFACCLCYVVAIAWLNIRCGPNIRSTGQ